MWIDNITLKRMNATYSVDRWRNKEKKIVLHGDTARNAAYVNRWKYLKKRRGEEKERNGL